MLLGKNKIIYDGLFITENVSCMPVLNFQHMTEVQCKETNLTTAAGDDLQNYVAKSYDTPD